MRLRAAAIAALGGALMLALDLRLGMWVDEGDTLETTAGTIRNAAEQAMRYELYPPLYFIALTAWRKLNRSPEFARAFSSVMALLAVRDGAAALRTFVPEMEDEAATAALALHTHILWSGTETRAYAQTVWLSAKMLRAYHDAYVEPKGALPRIRFVAWTLAAMYTHYYAGFLFAGCGVATLVHRRRAFRAFAIDAAIVAAGIAPLLQVIRVQAGTYTQNFAVPFSTVAIMRMTAGTITAFAVPSAHLGRIWRPIAGTAALAIGASLAIDRAARREAAIPVTIVLFATGLFTVALDRLRVPPILPAQASALAVPAVIAAAASLRTKRRTRRYAAFVAALGINAAVARLNDNAKLGDWRRVGAYLQECARAGEAIVVFHAEATLALRYHIGKKLALTAIPEEITFDRYDLHRYAIRDQGHVAQAFARAGAGETVWLVTTDETATMGVDFRAGELERYVSAHYRVAGDRRFAGSRVRQLRAVA